MGKTMMCLQLVHCFIHRLSSLSDVIGQIVGLIVQRSLQLRVIVLQEAGHSDVFSDLYLRMGTVCTSEKH